RTSQGAVAWIISLNTFPWIAVPAYWIFGRNNFIGYVSARQENDMDLKALVQSLIQKHPNAFRDTGNFYPETHAAEKLARIPVMKGNRAELLIDGEKTFRSIFEGIESAESYVLVQYFIVKDDTLGRKLKDLLIRKARAGVAVYFLYDEVGSQSL